MPLPQPLKIELIAPEATSSASSGEDKVADWAAAVQQLRNVAQWVIGGVIASIVAIFATSAFAKLGSMSPPEDTLRLSLAGLGFVLAIGAIACIFHFGVRVITPPGSSLRRLAESSDSSADGKARNFLYDLHNLDQATYPLITMMENPEAEASKRYLPRFRETLSFALVKTRFDTLLKVLYRSLPFAVAGVLLFTWAANPAPSKIDTELVEITTYSNGSWKHTLTTTADSEAWKKALAATADSEADRIDNAPAPPPVPQLKSIK